ncbi:MAG: DUF5054 domain-containing protein [Clostridia bacterium]|nr:DUF5054 domain-containing protein [Clostridia bacterium]
MEKEVLVIFKTHLDVGFTDLSQSILDKYLKEYIPNAIKVGYELKGSDTPFVWTVGSWLIWQALKHDTDGTVERAICDGILRWHALPFTTHTELMDPTLFAYGLNLSRQLDERFGYHTIGAKMSDVPGHTIGIVPIMKKFGVEFLHIGVNPATPLPPVPPVFRWRLGNDEIVVMYQGDYGEEITLGSTTVIFAHTGDNLGPQNADQVREIYKKLAEEHPDAKLKASTIDDLAQRAMSLPNLPVVEDEIGDTWIHGLGTDPEKVSRFKRIQRHIASVGGTSLDLTDSLLCVPEHTWGMDLKSHFPYSDFYSHEDIIRMAEQRAPIEASWREQRTYVARAEELLGIIPDYPISEPELSEYCECDIPPEIGFEVSWQLFDASDYEQYKREYMRCFSWWAIWDFTKVGLPDYKGGIFKARVTKAYQKKHEMLYRLEFDSEITKKYGLPYLYFRASAKGVELKWFGKQPSRLPQALWLKILGLEESFEIRKMGVWIRPEKILGSPLISATDFGVRNEEYTIESLDCALVAPYGRQLLRYGVCTEKQDLYFNLYNNIWNTNFPMWYSDNALFRFLITKNQK